MNLEEAIANLKNPRNPYDTDLIAIRVVLLDLVGKGSKSEKKDEKKEKKGRKKK